MEIEAIQELIQMDEDTRKKVDDIHAKKYQIKQDTDQAKKEISEQAWKDVNAKVDATKIKLDDEIVQKETATQVAYEKASAALTALYQDNREKWIQQLTDRALSFEDDRK